MKYSDSMLRKKENRKENYNYKSLKATKVKAERMREGIKDNEMHYIHQLRYRAMKPQ